MLKKPSLLWFLILMIIVTPITLLGYTDYRLSTFWVLVTTIWIYRQRKQVDSLFKVEGFASVMDIMIKNLYAWGLAYGIMAMGIYNIYDFVIFNDAFVDGFDVWLRDAYHAVVAYLWMSLFMACIILYNVKKKILFPIKGMVDKISASVNNAEDILQDENNGQTINLEPHNEVEILDASCSQMAKSIRHSLSVIKANKEKEFKLENEINVAHKIQQGVLPNLNEVNEALETYGFSVQGGMNANESIGGDMFDCIKLDDDHLLINIADVSGEGVTAAVFMMMTQAMVYDNMDKGDPNEIMARTNDFLATHNPNKLFVTMWLGIVELSTGKITYVSAGHNPPLLKDNNTGKAEYLRDKSGLVLGLMPRRKYKVFERVLQPNSMLYLYTDGISEARDVNKDFFGETRLQEAVEAAQKPEDVLAKVYEFVGEAPQSDDMTYICLMRSEVEKMELIEEKSFLATAEHMEEILGWCNNHIDSLFTNRKAAMRMRLVMEEAVVNVFRYAYKESDKDPVLVLKVGKEGEFLCFEMADQGTPFNPLENITADPNLKLFERTEGGWGRSIMFSFTDASKYCYKDGWNILSLKKLDTAPVIVNKKRHPAK